MAAGGLGFGTRASRSRPALAAASKPRVSPEWKALIARVGQNLQFTETVSNNGPNPAAGVTLASPLPANVTLVSATSSQGPAPTQAGGTLTAMSGQDVYFLTREAGHGGEDGEFVVQRARVR